MLASARYVSYVTGNVLRSRVISSRGILSTTSAINIKPFSSFSSWKNQADWTMEEVGRTPSSITFRNSRIRKLYNNELYCFPDNNPAVDNLGKLFERGLRRDPGRVALGHFTHPEGSAGPVVHPVTFEQFHAVSARYAAALRRGVANVNATTKQKHVGVYMANCVEYCFISLACAYSKSVLIALYDTLGQESSQHILGETEVSLMFVDSTDKIEKLTTLKEKMPEKILIDTIVFIGDKDSIEDVKADQAGIKIIHLDDFLNTHAPLKTASKGDNLPSNIEDFDAPPLDLAEVSPDDLYTIQYTSGTTGVPKGVTLSHKNVVADVAGFMEALNSVGTDYFKPPHEGSSTFSYLPFAHIYPVIVLYWYMYIGGQVFVSNSGSNPARMLAEVRASQCTLFPLVPRTVNRLNDAIANAVAKMPEEKRRKFEAAYAHKKALYDADDTLTRSSWADEEMKPFRAMLGGNVDLMVCAAAPVAQAALEKLRIVFGVFVPEVYGQTELSGGNMICLNPRAAGNASSVGFPWTTTELKVVDCPELGLAVHRDAKGELCFRGPTLMQYNYFNRPDANAEAIDGEGFFRTGDVGEILKEQDGSIRIVDRCKHVFKLSQGEYVAPEKIEQLLVADEHVAQIFVDGHSDQAYLVAVVVPDRDALAAKGRDIDDPLLPADIVASLDRLAKDKGLTGLERVKAVHVHKGEPFSPQNDLLTPTLKAKRSKLAAFFKDEVAELYKKGPQT